MTEPLDADLSRIKKTAYKFCLSNFKKNRLIKNISFPSPSLALFSRKNAAVRTDRRSLLGSTTPSAFVCRRCWRRLPATLLPPKSDGLREKRQKPPRCLRPSRAPSKTAWAAQFGARFAGCTGGENYGEKPCTLGRARCAQAVGGLKALYGEGRPQNVRRPAFTAKNSPAEHPQLLRVEKGNIPFYFTARFPPEGHMEGGKRKNVP